MFLSVVLPFSSRFLAARVLFWLFLCRGKDLCRQPFGIPVEHARDENAVTIEFLGHVSGNTMPPAEFALQFHFLAPPVSSTSGLAKRIS